MIAFNKVAVSRSNTTPTKLTTFEQWKVDRGNLIGREQVVSQPALNSSAAGDPSFTPQLGGLTEAKLGGSDRNDWGV